MTGKIGQIKNLLWPATPRPFQHPVYTRVWFTGICGSLARYVDYTIVAWLLVQQTESSFEVGLLVFFRWISHIFLGPWIGSLLDSHSRIKILRLSQLGMALGAGCFGLIVLNDLASTAVIYGYSAVMGFLFMVEIQSKRTYVSKVIGRSFVSSMIALEMVALHVGWLIGSTLGGGIINFVSPSSAFFMVSFVMFLNVLVLRRLPSMFSIHRIERQGKFFTSIRETFVYVRSNKTIWACLLVVGINNFFGYSFESMAPKFAQDVYETGPVGFGIVLAAQGIGTFVMTGYFALRRKSIKNPGLWLITATTIQLIGSIGFSFTQTTLLGVISIVSLGMVSGVFTVTHTSIILLTSSANRWGRVMGFQVVMMGLYPFGSLLLGLTADTIGLAHAIRLFAVLGLLLLIVIWFRYTDLRRPI